MPTNAPSGFRNFKALALRAKFKLAIRGRPLDSGIPALIALFPPSRDKNASDFSSFLVVY